VSGTTDSFTVRLGEKGACPLFILPFVGPIVDGIVAGVGMLLFGKDIGEAGIHFINFFFMVDQAQTYEELVRAAGEFAIGFTGAAIATGTFLLPQGFKWTFCFLPEPGSKAWACNVLTGEWTLCTVRNQWGHEHAGEIVHVHFAGEVISATDRHPFWVMQGRSLSDRTVPEHIPDDERDRSAPGRWVAANELQTGDQLLLRSGRSAVIERIVIEYRTATVYNLQIDDCHTFAVGESGIVVHNAGGTDKIRGKVQDAITKRQQGKKGKGTQTGAAQFRSFKSFDALKRELGPAGDGKVWHHIVEQRLEGKFGAEAIHNTNNVVAISWEANQAIANYYSRVRSFTNGMTVRKWLETQSFAQQEAFGRRIMNAVLRQLWN
jgi:hypothetical protein